MIAGNSSEIVGGPARYIHVAVKRGEDEFLGGMSFWAAITLQSARKGSPSWGAAVVSPSRAKNSPTVKRVIRAGM